jgi:arsenite methyltransferase
MSAVQRVGRTDAVRASGSVFIWQQQTDSAFDFKWLKRDTYESDPSKNSMRRWLIERYCQGDPGNLDKWLCGYEKIVLDAGRREGFSAASLFGESLRDHDYLGVDFSISVEGAHQRCHEAAVPGDFLWGDITWLGISEASIDIIFSEAVVHRTDSTKKSLKQLAKKSAPGRRFLFCV